MKIRVLHVIDHLAYGGAQTVLKNILEKIGNEHIESFVCALRTEPLAMPIKARLISLTYGKHNPCTILAIAKLCRKHDIDIVHAHLQKAIISSLFASFLCNSKIIVHEHGPIFCGGTGFVYRLFLRALGWRARLAIANSQATKKALNRTGRFAEESISVVSNFVDFERFDPAFYDRTERRNALGIAENKIVVGFVGRLDYCKGADLLLDAAAQLLKEHNHYHFIVVGDGREKNRLIKQCRRLGLDEKVAFTGLHKNPAEVISAFDIAVIPSRREAFGVTAVELMRMAVPLIASSAGGLPELVQNEQTGILLDSLNPENIADAVRRLAEDSALRDSLVKNAEVFSRKFDGRTQLNQITDIYNCLAKVRKFTK